MKPGSDRSMASPWDQRSNNFDFLRLALAVLVIYSHSFPLGLGTEDAEPVRRVTHGQMTGGAIAVDLFFIMSGFLITASAERSRTMHEYLKKRVKRIYPAFLALALVTLVVFLPLSGGRILPFAWVPRVGDFVIQTLRLREFDYAGAFAGNPFPDVINGSTWSIQYEFWCYIGVALLTLAGLLRRRMVVLGLFLLSLCISVAWVAFGIVRGGEWLNVLFGSPQLWARLLPLYLAGMVFYLFRERIPLNGGIALAAAAALAIGAWTTYGCTVAFPIAGTYLVFYLAYAPWLRVHGVGRYGDFSYGTYLYAFPVEQLVMKGFGHTVQPLVLFACATPVTLLLACASWYGVERRFLQPSRRKETIVHAVEEKVAS
jgi:peptidoglycan/LPS O-acetylase OafA/YrhL